MNDPELPAWVRRAQQGDRGAFEKIVRATDRLVYTQIAASVRDRQKAEDLTQETFIAAWKSLATVQDGAYFTPWLLTVARNAVLDAAKFDGRKKRRAGSAKGEAAEDLPDRAPLPPEKVQSDEAAAQALRILEELPEDYRRPLMLRYLGSADYETMKRQLNLSDGALRGLLSRGMAMLRERMTRGAENRR